MNITEKLNQKRLFFNRNITVSLKMILFFAFFLSGMSGLIFQIVWVRMLSGKERDAFDDETQKLGKAKLHNARARLAVLLVCDEEGSRIFTDEDADTLGDHCCLYLDRIFEIGGSLNGLYQRDLDESVKNSDSGPSDDSGSNSPDAGAAP